LRADKLFLATKGDGNSTKGILYPNSRISRINFEAPIHFQCSINFLSLDRTETTPITLLTTLSLHRSDTISVDEHPNDKLISAQSISRKTESTTPSYSQLFVDDAEGQFDLQWPGFPQEKQFPGLPTTALTVL
jgi:hypothetical protein